MCINQSFNVQLINSLSKSLLKMLPTSNDMILPDDNNPALKWDADLKK